MSKIQAVSESPTLKILLGISLSVSAGLITIYMKGTESDTNKIVKLVEEQNKTQNKILGALQLLQYRVDLQEKTTEELKRNMINFHNGKMSLSFSIRSVPNPPKPSTYKRNKFAIPTKKHRLWM